MISFAPVVCGRLTDRLLMNICCNIPTVKRIIIMKIMKDIHLSERAVGTHGTTGDAGAMAGVDGD
jgi:hypothetical protein